MSRARELLEAQRWSLLGILVLGSALAAVLALESGSVAPPALPSASAPRPRASGTPTEAAQPQARWVQLAALKPAPAGASVVGEHELRLGESPTHFELGKPPRRDSSEYLVGLQGRAEKPAQLKLHVPRRGRPDQWSSLGSVRLGTEPALVGVVVDRRRVDLLRRVYVEHDPELNVLVRSLVLWPLTSTLELNIGAKEARGFLGGGFHEDETGENGRNATWCGGDLATLRLPLAPANQDYHLVLTAYGYQPLVPLKVAVSVNGIAAGEVIAREAWSLLGVRVPRRLLRSGLNRVDLRFEKSARPAEVFPGEKDRRLLALRLDELKLEPYVEP